MNKDQDYSALKPGSRWRWATVLALLAVAGGYYFYQAGRQNQENADARANQYENAPVSVAIALTRQGDLPIYLSGLGTVTPLHTVTVRSRVDGELIRVAFTEGQAVRQGELLAEIDPRPYQVAVQQAEGQLLRDEALLKNAKIDQARYQTLLEQDSIAAQQTATQAALVKQYRGTVEIDRAQLDNTKLQLSYARITAPVTGRIGLRLVDQGNMIRAGDVNGLAVITQIQPISVVFTLPEDQIPAVMRRWRSGDAIVIDAYDRAGQQKLASGKLLAVDNQIDASTGTLKLKAQFDNEDRTLFANQFVNVKMHLDTLLAATLAPSAAIQHGANGAFVYLVKDDNSITVRHVKTGPTDGETVAILEGLAPNEKLVIDGADKLREGSQVNVIDKAKPAVPSPGKPAN
ncbi:multidrug efflux system membrane fusion protein [Methylomonas methanica]|uniref:Multidrug transporter subunit MdtA n=3 Tax=Methylococcaceae TaxID=403 RepID=A0A126T1Y0_9GAMM|nr:MULTISPECIES: MdtA/MuxA family multidrug efflux RND transporter periplasmic adaptor subunit [Methylomonas]AMK76092.1 multidrug transporter subunit MdtA [Methylomonas denitrificans]OAH99782.1 multidrug transporter subunit MdtA [Methylomonas methanica]TCV83887.1 multidrug efflux system membrane fusion protein [Methylomonas methanica]